eukprot:CAMPEP_0182423840 /NCGR_PEP_ID=MMETSP1167-20130531/9917_1 /TAXON_ID=2988 /ORGANISM="Mallomonas Sp, Strain CCMP3275" /LENGTH=477 /DNA_ID=CAMNT_0024603141 /DNA_START=437 /DNA_END=1870 /DNA_ORIENTATION=-
MRSYKFSSSSKRMEPIVMIAGDVRGKENVLVRVHDQCFTSEVLGSLRCDCREQLHEFLEIIKETEDGGILIYLQQEGRGIGLSNKIAAYSLQDRGLDTVDANVHLGFKDEQREYSVVPDILNDLEVKSIRLVTNNPFKIRELTNLGVKIHERVPLEIVANSHNDRYLKSKRDRMGHILSPSAIKQSIPFQPMPRFEEPTQAPTQVPSTSSSSSSSSPSLSPASALGTRGGSCLTPPEPSEALPVMAGLDVMVDSKTAITPDLKPPPVPYAFGKETVVDAIAAVSRGEVVVVVDDEDRENEGDLIMSAELATAEAIGFIVRYSSGVICVSLEGSRLDELNLPPMVINNEDPKQTAYSVSVDCKYNTSTGISSADRAMTFRTLANRDYGEESFYRPGHVFPLRYKPGGVLSRAGHTEASLDLTRLAGLSPGGVLAEVVHDDGSMMRLPSLKEFAKQHKLVLTSVQDLIAYRMETELNRD